MPTPVIVGTGGRIPPATVIEDDANGSVETGGVFDHGKIPIVGDYKLLPSTTPAITAKGLAKEVAAAAGAGQVMVGTMNVENLSPSDPVSRK